MWHIIPPSKLTEEYFRRLSRNVGVSQRLRARIHGRMAKTCALEIAKWGATLLLALKRFVILLLTAVLALTMPPRKSRWLLRLRWGIARGIFCGPGR